MESICKSFVITLPPLNSFSSLAAGEKKEKIISYQQNMLLQQFWVFFQYIPNTEKLFFGSVACKSERVKWKM